MQQGAPRNIAVAKMSIVTTVVNYSRHSLLNFNAIFASTMIFATATAPECCVAAAGRGLPNRWTDIHASAMTCACKTLHGRGW
jgi:hypothetical protein